MAVTRAQLGQCRVTHCKQLGQIPFDLAVPIAFQFGVQQGQSHGRRMIVVQQADPCAADELGISGVRVNGIRPGLIRTELTEAVLMSPEVSADYRECTPLERIGEVEDIANVALFLLSDAAGYVTGQIINVDGGMQVRRGPDYSAMFEPLFGADALRGVV